jgi:hypothetical protein
MDQVTRSKILKNGNAVVLRNGCVYNDADTSIMMESCIRSLVY